jgi:hypothetical protein
MDEGFDRVVQTGGGCIRFSNSLWASVPRISPKGGMIKDVNLNRGPCRWTRISKPVIDTRADRTEAAAEFCDRTDRITPATMGMFKDLDATSAAA